MKQVNTTNICATVAGILSVSAAVLGTIVQILVL
ncbi:MAG: hypothetical protein ACI9FJ_000815 [Alteromonadaceae bacterium]|jgi:hypothetical protein